MSTPSTTPFMPRGTRPRRPLSPERRRQIQRRRAIALGVIALGVLLLAKGIGSLFGGSSHHAAATAVSPPPIISLEAEVQATLRRRALAQNVGTDRVLSYTPFVTSGGAKKKQIALTFDDGPGPYTPGIVNTLKKEHVPATFFEVGFLEPTFTRARARPPARATSSATTPSAMPTSPACRRPRSATRSTPRPIGCASSASLSRASSGLRTARSTTPR